MEKFNPIEFLKEMQGILKQFKEELIKDIDKKIERSKEEKITLKPPPHPPIGIMLKKEIVLVDWEAKMTKALSDQETKDFSQELFNLMQKYGFDTLKAKKKKENLNSSSNLT